LNASTVHENPVTLRAADGYELAATSVEPGPETERTGGVVLGSALGVPRYYYLKFARYLAGNGFSVLTFDYRGIYESRGGIPGSEMKMEDWGRMDIEAALQWISDRDVPGPLFYIGHSCGGQLVCLAPSCERLDAMVFVAAQSGYWKYWAWPYQWGIRLLWKLLLFAARFFDYLPTRLFGISSVDLPAGVARQWAQWGMTPGYLFNDVHGLDISRYRRFDRPLLAYIIEDDPIYAPPASVEALLSEYPNAEVDKRHVTPADYGRHRIGHFGFFRERFRESLWKETVEWLAWKGEGRTG